MRVFASRGSGVPSCLAVSQTSSATAEASTYNRRMAAISAADVSTRSSSWIRPTRMCGRFPSASRASDGAAPGAVSPTLRSGMADGMHQQGELVGRDTSFDRDALDADSLQAPDQLAVGFTAARNGQVPDHDILADDADGENGLVGEQLGARFGQGAEPACHERMAG